MSVQISTAPGVEFVIRAESTTVAIATLAALGRKTCFARSARLRFAPAVFLTIDLEKRIFPKPLFRPRPSTASAPHRSA
jgi:hypothetical protein